MNVKELIEALQKYFKSDDKVKMEIFTDTGISNEAFIKEIYRDPDDDDCPVLSNIDEDGDWE